MICLRINHYDPFLLSRGRGSVHLTWKRNYRKAKEHFCVDFVEQPDKAAELKHSIPIMILGMKTGIFTGTDQQSLIAGYAQKFEAILRETSVAKETFNP